MNRPLVSIGLPTYNRANDLRACLANLTDLNYKNIEIIISDNHSPDATAEVSREYVKKDKRIRYYRQKSNIGVSKNSLFVLKKAKGKYFFWASDDDLRDRKYLSETIPLLEKNPHATLAITDTTLFTKTRSQVIPLYYFKTCSHSPRILFTYLLHPECVSVLLYGVHRLNNEFIQGAITSVREKRPFGVMGYDNSFAIFLLLRGDLIYIPQNLFFIRDNGLYLSVYQDLSELKLSRAFIQKIFRYLLFPIMFACDLYYGTLYIFRSSVPFYLKLVLFISLTLKFLCDIILFLFSIIKAGIILIIGLTLKLYHYSTLLVFRKIKRPQP
jgi:glycosyltransferase involved in cell wall biosynthesis